MLAADDGSSGALPGITLPTSKGELTLAQLWDTANPPGPSWTSPRSIKPAHAQQAPCAAARGEVMPDPANQLSGCRRPLSAAPGFGGSQRPVRKQ